MTPVVTQNLTVTNERVATPIVQEGKMELNLNEQQKRDLIEHLESL